MNAQRGEVYVFTDGNCKGNGTEDARAGFGIYFLDMCFHHLNQCHLIQDKPSNQKAELSAINFLMKTIVENGNLFHGKAVYVCADSMYAIKCITEWSHNWMKNGWLTSKKQQVKHAELIKDILTSKSHCEDTYGVIFVFKHVYSHTREPQDTGSMEYFYWFGNKSVDDMINDKLATLNLST
jgi:ribonuclease HI